EVAHCSFPAVTLGLDSSKRALLFPGSRHQRERGNHPDWIGLLPACSSEIEAYVADFGGGGWRCTGLGTAAKPGSMGRIRRSIAPHSCCHIRARTQHTEVRPHSR